MVNATMTLKEAYWTAVNEAYCLLPAGTGIDSQLLDDTLKSFEEYQMYRTSEEWYLHHPARVLYAAWGKEDNRVLFHLAKRLENMMNKCFFVSKDEEAQWLWTNALLNG